QTAAVDIAAGMAAIDHGRAAEAGPFLPGGVSDAVGRRAVGISGAARPAAAVGQDQGEQKNCWQPQTEPMGGSRAGRLPANTNIDEGAVEIHVRLAGGKINSCYYWILP